MRAGRRPVAPALIAGTIGGAQPRSAHNMKENILSNRSLFRPLQLGSYTLKNRIVLPPLTRQRSTQPGNAANELMATYYQQRAGAGLLISEGTQIEPRGEGYAWTPGIYSPGPGRGLAQGHRGRTRRRRDHLRPALARRSRLPQRAAAGGRGPRRSLCDPGRPGQRVHRDCPGAGTLVPPSVPRALSTAEVKELVQLYAQAARNALDAGFDGVEIHAANGYLV
ncbi:FAD/FMN-binding oxidoreductase [Klebsiella pneumoniae]|nr:FAD/FMN-binding oxidoreductase [Klebsiella pneumoniae]